MRAVNREMGMQAIIPAAGLGTRMLPFSAAAAKELAPIGTKPAIQHTLEEAFACGVSAAVVVVSPEKKSLMRFLEGDLSPSHRRVAQGADWLQFLEKMPLSIAEQPEPLGLGDALLRGWRQGSDEHFYLMYPDNYIVDGAAVFNSLITSFLATGLTCVACKRDKPYFRGNNFVILGAEHGEAYCATSFTRRDDPRPAEGAVFYRAAGRVLVTNEYFHMMEEIRAKGVQGELDDIHAYRSLAEKRRILAVPPVCEIHDTGCAEGYSDAWREFLNK